MPSRVHEHDPDESAPRSARGQVRCGAYRPLGTGRLDLRPDVWRNRRRPVHGARARDAYALHRQRQTGITRIRRGRRRDGVRVAAMFASHHHGQRRAMEPGVTMRTIGISLIATLLATKPVSAQVRADPGVEIGNRIAVRVNVTLADEETPYSPARDVALAFSRAGAD